MDLKEHLSILNHFLIIYVERVKNGSFLKPTVLRFEPRLMICKQGSLSNISRRGGRDHNFCAATEAHFSRLNMPPSQKEKRRDMIEVHAIPVLVDREDTSYPIFPLFL